MFCVKCGAENVDTGKFCRKCGAPMRQLKKDVETVPEPPPKPLSDSAKPLGETKSGLEAHTGAKTETKPLEKNAPELKPNIAGMLCYLLWWLTGIVFLFLKKEDKFVCFHAWQSILTFAILSALIILLNTITLAGGFLFTMLVIVYWLVFALAIFLWLFLMFKAYKGQMFKLPLVGSLAQRLSNS